MTIGTDVDNPGDSTGVGVHGGDCCVVSVRMICVAEISKKANYTFASEYVGRSKALYICRRDRDKAIFSTAPWNGPSKIFVAHRILEFGSCKIGSLYGVRLGGRDHVAGCRRRKCCSPCVRLSANGKSCMSCDAASLVV